MSETCEPYMSIPGYDAWKLASPPGGEELSIRLEPCPCCGGRAEWDDVEIECSVCGLRMPGDVDETKTAYAWNRRKLGYFLGGSR